MQEKLSFEYIRGLVDGEGCFSFHTVPVKDHLGNRIKMRIPAFMLGVSIQDINLVIAVKETLGLRNRIYEYSQERRRDGYNRQPIAMLVVRDLGQLKNIIIPLFYKSLPGNKARQFDNWMFKMGNDPTVLERYKILYTIYKSGFYDKYNRYTTD